MSGITKIMTYGYKQTKSLTIDAAKEVAGVRKIPQDIKLGYDCGKRLSQINRADSRRRMQTISTGMLRKGVVNHLPGIMAGIGILIPGLGTNVLGFVLGKAMKKVFTRILI